jgi:hypothetical protein
MRAVTAGDQECSDPPKVLVLLEMLSQIDRMI